MTRYFPYKRTNGILHYLYNKSQSNYYDEIYLEESSHDSNYVVKNAFDFSDESHWTPLPNNFGNRFLKICFNNYFVKLESFEVTTSIYDCQPQRFVADYSPTGGAFYGQKDFQQQIAKGEVRNFDYLTSKFKCFRYIALEQNCAKGYHDIVQIEFFGSIFHNNCNIVCSDSFINWLSLISHTSLAMIFI